MFMSHSSGGWKFKVKVMADVVPGENLLPSLCVHTALAWWEHGGRGGSMVSPYKGTSPLGSGPHPWCLRGPLVNPNTVGI